MKVDRITESGFIAEDSFFESSEKVSIRPKSFAEYPGQKRAKENLSVYVKAATKRADTLDHVLLHGPPGLGKTTLAQIVAKEMASPFQQTSGPIYR